MSFRMLSVLTILVMIALVKFSGSTLVEGDGFGMNYHITDDQRLRFGEMEVFTTTDSFVYNIEADISEGKKILFDDGRSLKISNGTHTDILAGSATDPGYVNGYANLSRFGYIAGFLQLNESVILLVDNTNHCLRFLDRTAEAVSDYTGQCRVSGYVNGLASVARFRYPTSIIRDRRYLNGFLITDSSNNAIRTLDMDTSEIGTLYRSESNLRSPKGIVWEPMRRNSLLITPFSSIKRLDVENNILVSISGDDNGWWKDGTIEESVYNQPRHIVFPHPNVYMVTDKYNDRIRLIDMQNDRVTSLCHKRVGLGLRTSFNYRCHMGKSRNLLQLPIGLLLHRNILYVGTSKTIYSIPVVLENYTSNYSILRPEQVSEESNCLSGSASNKKSPLLAMRIAVGVLACLEAAMIILSVKLCIKIKRCQHSHRNQPPHSRQLEPDGEICELPILPPIQDDRLHEVPMLEPEKVVYTKPSVQPKSNSLQRQLRRTYSPADARNERSAQEEEAIYNCIYKSNYITIEDCGLSVVELHPLNPSNSSHSVQPNVEPRPDVIVPLHQISRDPYNPYSYASVPSPHRDLPPLPESEQSDNGYIDTNTLDIHYALNTIDKLKATDERTGDSLELQNSQEDAGGRIETRKSLEEEPTIPAKPGYARVEEEPTIPAKPGYAGVEEEPTIPAKPGCVGAVEIASTPPDSGPTKIHDD